MNKLGTLIFWGLLIQVCLADPGLEQVSPVSKEVQSTSSPMSTKKSIWERVLFSVRAEALFFRNYKDTIREDDPDRSKLYFSNIYLNAEASLSDSTDFIVEFQPLTSDLYQLGGFLSIAESLEGISSDPDEEQDDDPRLNEIDALVSSNLKDLDRASDRPSFERAQVSHYFNDIVSIDIGRVRNPFSFWDDYSLFRNLSAGKTDPISLGVPLRRADYGMVLRGTIAKPFRYSAGILSGHNTIEKIDILNHQDLVFKIDGNFGDLDLGASYYRHDVTSGDGPIHGMGVHFRYRLSYDLTVIGEYIFINNSEIDVTTRSFYLQANYDLSELLTEGLRLNVFLESYNSDLLKVDLEEDLDYRFAGTSFQSSSGLIYTVNRNLDLGAQILVGLDEEESTTLKAAFKADLKF